MSRASFIDVIGFSRQPPSLREIGLSGLGGFFGIFAIFLTSAWFLGKDAAVAIVPSMGASAVLLFAAPHVPFSQPWNVFAGHAVSAVIGVACWQWIPDYATAASASVGIAIAVMYALRCTHPPGGATALAAVIGSEKLHQLGFSYEYAPILLNTVTILLVAIAFNSLFHWRKYPAHRPGAAQKTLKAEHGYPPIRHEDFVYALSQLDTIVDVDEEDLVEIYRLATRRPGREQPGS